MKTISSQGINFLETLTLDTTYNHLVSLFGDEKIYDYISWIGINYHKFNMYGYDDMSNTLGLIEDMYGMFLLDIKCWEEYMILNATEHEMDGSGDYLCDCCNEPVNSEDWCFTCHSYVYAHHIND